MVRNPWLSIPVTTGNAALVTGNLGAIRTAMPNLPNLTPDDKSGCMKVGNPQRAMIDQIERICIQHPLVMPAYHSVPEFRWRNESIKNLLMIQGDLVSLLEAVDNALMGAQDDTMRMALDYYYALKRASKSAMPGLHKQYMAVRENFIHETGQTIEEQFPEKADEGNAADGGGNTAV